MPTGRTVSYRAPPANTTASLPVPRSALRSEALLDAGDLYAQSNSRDRALDAYNRYVKEFPKPVETAIETRFKIAEMYKAAHDETLYHQQLEEIVSVDAGAGSEKDRPDSHGCGTFALVLAEQLYGNFVVVKLRQPFETSLQDKKQRMDATMRPWAGWWITESTR